MTVAAFVISVLALLASGGAVWYARRQANASDRSAVAAEDSAQSSRQAAEAAARSAIADERAVELAEIDAAKYSPPWALRWKAGDTYMLINDSDEAAHDVEIDLGDMHVARGDVRHERIGPRSAVALMVARHMGTRSDTATVTWSRLPGGDRLDWSYPFPTKPR